MKLNEIINESGFTTLISENSVNEFNQIISSIILPLKADGVEKITLDQISQMLQHNMQSDNIKLDNNALMNLLSNNPVIQKVEIDPDNNDAMTAFLKIPVNNRYTDKDTEEKEKEKINKSALNAIKDKMK